MNKARLLCLVLALSLSIGCACMGGASNCSAGGPVLRHVVLFKFNAETTPGQAKVIEEAFRALPTKIPGIVGFEWGTNVSPENLSQGFTHCFFLTFRTEADRNAYLPHPEHKAFGALLDGRLDKACVVDYWTQK